MFKDYSEEERQVLQLKLLFKLRPHMELELKSDYEGICANPICKNQGKYLIKTKDIERDMDILEFPLCESCDIFPYSFLTQKIIKANGFQIQLDKYNKDMCACYRCDNDRSKKNDKLTITIGDHKDIPICEICNREFELSIKETKETNE